VKVRLTLGLAVLACALTPPSAVSAEVSGTTITVNTTADSTGGPGCTLRDAITAANTDAVTGGCVAGHGTDSIGFSVSGQINLGGTLPAVVGQLTIDGSGQSLTVDGQGAVRVLEISAAGSVALDELTIADGNDVNNGGGIDNNGTLTVENSRLSGNNGDLGGGVENGGTLSIRTSSFSGYSAGVGAGIENRGTLTVEDTSFSGNNAFGTGGAIANLEGGRLAVRHSSFSENFGGSGGGIVNFGRTLIVESSIFSGNGADAGGGIFSSFDSTLVVAKSTFSENHAMSGGAVESAGSGTVQRSTFAGNDAVDEGGAIENLGTLRVTNSTFASNVISSFGLFGGGIFNRAEGTIRVTNSTFSSNSAPEGGGVANLGTATLKNTIVAGSTQGTNCSGAFTAASTNNLSDDGTCSPGFTQVGLADMQLGPLGDNGGPTQTIALGSGSVAINAGDNAAAAGLITDQRGAGFPRIVNGRVDIGAFEVQRGA
jgi:CSLREA domain-containing protein